MENIRKFIFDTDIGPDCDDCGALAIMDTYHKAGKIELLGVTHCTSDKLGVNIIAAIHDHFGVSTPIGQTDRQGFLATATKYTKPVSELYLQNHPAPAYETALPLLRRLLAENRNVTMVFVGPLNNMKDLLRSGGDDISPLTGEELIRQSVDQVIVMGGDFQYFDHKEYNIECDIEAAQLMTEKCAAPIVYCGHEAGRDVMTGATLENCPDDHPVKLSYYYYLDGKYIRNSWDLVTVYYAVEPELDKWILSEECAIRFNDDGTSVVSEGSGARYVRYADERELEGILNEIIAK